MWGCVTFFWTELYKYKYLPAQFELSSLLTKEVNAFGLKEYDDCPYCDFEKKSIPWRLRYKQVTNSYGLDLY